MALWGLVGKKANSVGRKYDSLVAKINALEDAMQGLSDAQLKEKTTNLKQQLKQGKTLDDILPEAFALVRETAKRNLGQRHYDVQLMGGVALHQGKIAEMRTGEGKTLSATLPTYLNALTEKGVHIVTVNDYLARRDAVWMGQVYDALGLSVGVIAHDSAFLYDKEHTVEEHKQEQEADKDRDETGSFRIEESYLRPVARKEAYAADITYGTNNEFGFDYLRDNLVPKTEDKVQREFHYAIVDEVDSILIDESRTPLIISSPDAASSNLYIQFSQIVPQLQQEKDYTIDEKFRSVSLTQPGIEKVEQILGVDNLYDVAGGGSVRHIHALEQSLKAYALFEKDKDYVIRDNQVVIVDQFTGRMMPGRRFSEGLHQALEAKERVAIQRESRTVATVTFQNYFRMYEKLAGMTGTALTNEEEFLQVYRLEVVVIPTNRENVRIDYADMVFMNEDEKYNAVIEEIKERNAKGQPVLVGTTSIDRNEYLSKLLSRAGVKHEVLNAKNHEREGEIIAQAGKKGAVTVATNMAGRGVDIILGGNPPTQEQTQEVRATGGLHIIGTERHEARRIDNQLRGRAARQGDPGSGQFFLSLEDKMIKVFGGDRIQKMMSTLRVPKNQPIESKMVSSAIEGAQKKIEGMNFDTRKHLLEYDQVLNRQRNALYRKRDDILSASPEQVREIVEQYINQYLESLVFRNTAASQMSEWDIDGLKKEIDVAFDEDSGLKSKIDEIIASNKSVEEIQQDIVDTLQKYGEQRTEQHTQELEEEHLTEILQHLLLRSIDMLWMDHLEAMEYMRDAVRLRSYGQRDPLAEYKGEGSRMFEELEQNIAHTVSVSFFHIHKAHPATQTQQKQVLQVNKTDSPATQSSAKPKQTVGRNDPCPCGSGKKYKKCCG